MLAALWILEFGLALLRVAATSPVVVQGLCYGNLTVLLVLAIAVAWRYRDRTRLVGLAVGAGMAAKLFVWPLVVWLVVTKRYPSRCVGSCSRGVLVLGAWALLGFEGLPTTRRFYARYRTCTSTRSVSLGTVAGGVGTSVSTAVAVCCAAGLVLLGVAAWVARRGDGDRRAFAIAVLACVVASPIVWPYYFTFLLVADRDRVARFAPVWLYGYAIWLVGVVAPKSTVVEGHVCCRPRGVPEQAWLWSHADPSPWYAAGVMAAVVLVGFAAAVSRRRSLA